MQQMREQLFSLTSERASGIHETPSLKHNLDKPTGGNVLSFQQAIWHGDALPINTDEIAISTANCKYFRQIF